MKQPNKELLEKNLKEWLKSNSFSPDLDSFKYEVELDLSDTKDLSSNIEQIMNFWVLPKKINKELYKKQAIDLLVTGTNEIPLWIGVTVKKQKIKLIISKRFRKLKEVKFWHKENDTLPFINENELKAVPEFFKEFCFLYPSSMYDNETLESEEFKEICNILVLEEIDYEEIEKRLSDNVENKEAEILKINSRKYSDQYILLDLWNHDQINVLNIYFRTNGANNDFIYRSLYRWNQRLWQDLGPKIKEVETGQLEILQGEGRKIEEYKKENAV